jgi:hypothetical protein
MPGKQKRNGLNLVILFEGQSLITRKPLTKPHLMKAPPPPSSTTDQGISFEHRIFGGHKVTELVCEKGQELNFSLRVCKSFFQLRLQENLKPCIMFLMEEFETLDFRIPNSSSRFSLNGNFAMSICDKVSMEIVRSYIRVGNLWA